MSPRKYDMSKRASAVEATRLRIVEATLAEHTTDGIAATSHEDVALRAGVAVGTVYRHFPTYPELVGACGRLIMERLALPGPEERAALFAGARSRQERIRRLVAAIFGVYERGAPAIAAARRERDVLPAVAEADDAVEGVLQGLVDEALAPLEPTPRRRAAVRALTELGVWQRLAARGSAARTRSTPSPLRSRRA